MKLSIWQFAALLAVLIVGYLVYAIWWADQDQVGWIKGLRNIFFASDEEMKSGKTEKAEPAPASDSGWIK